jgi:hypothetical protein
MNYVIDHSRGRCASNYKYLSDLGHIQVNNTKCIILGVKHTGALKDHDKTFNENTWLENSAELLGIKYSIAKSVKTAENFAFTDKLPLVFDMLNQTTYEYAIIADSVDSIIVNNPDLIVDILNYYDTNILCSTTQWPAYDYFTMPDKHSFIHSIYGNGVYLNSGVIGGKVSSLIDLYKRTLDYAGYEPTDNWNQMYNKRNGYMDWSEERLKNFPAGISCDQSIFRYLFQEFYPSIKLDVHHYLAAAR